MEPTQEGENYLPSFFVITNYIFHSIKEHQKFQSFQVNSPILPNPELAMSSRHCLLGLVIYFSLSFLLYKPAGERFYSNY